MERGTFYSLGGTEIKKKVNNYSVFLDVEKHLGIDEVLKCKLYYHSILATEY